MKNDKETKQKLIEAGKQEFMEKGYNKASLRNICKNAGVTTGALYFFFKDKEDLFSAIVSEPIEHIMKLMNGHYQAEIENLKKQDFSKTGMADDTMIGKQVIGYMYQFRDEVELVLTKAQGTKYENLIDQIVDITQRHYEISMDMKNKKEIESSFIHWMAHIQIDAFIYLFTHHATVEEAEKQFESVVKYLIGGWNAALPDYAVEM